MIADASSAALDGRMPKIAGQTVLQKLAPLGRRPIMYVCVGKGSAAKSCTIDAQTTRKNERDGPGTSPSVSADRIRHSAALVF